MSLAAAAVNPTVAAPAHSERLRAASGRRRTPSTMADDERSGDSGLRSSNLPVGGMLPYCSRRPCPRVGRRRRAVGARPPSCSARRTVSPSGSVRPPAAPCGSSSSTRCLRALSEMLCWHPPPLPAATTCLARCSTCPQGIAVRCGQWRGWRCVVDVCLVPSAGAELGSPARRGAVARPLSRCSPRRRRLPNSSTSSTFTISGDAQSGPGALAIPGRLGRRRRWWRTRRCASADRTADDERRAARGGRQDSGGVARGARALELAELKALQSAQGGSGGGGDGGGARRAPAASRRARRQARAATPAESDRGDGARGGGDGAGGGGGAAARAAAAAAEASELREMRRLEQKVSSASALRARAGPLGAARPREGRHRRCWRRLVVGGARPALEPRAPSAAREAPTSAAAAAAPLRGAVGGGGGGGGAPRQARRSVARRRPDVARAARHTWRT